MEGQAMFYDCPAYLGRDGAERCGLPAEVEAQCTIDSTDGPLDSAKIRCPRGHWFSGPHRVPHCPGAAGRDCCINGPAAASDHEAAVTRTDDGGDMRRLSWLARVDDLDMVAWRFRTRVWYQCQ